MKTGAILVEFFETGAILSGDLKWGWHKWGWQRQPLFCITLKNKDWHSSFVLKQGACEEIFLRDEFSEQNKTRGNTVVRNDHFWAHHKERVHGDVRPMLFIASST